MPRNGTILTQWAIGGIVRMPMAMMVCRALWRRIGHYGARGNWRTIVVIMDVCLQGKPVQYEEQRDDKAKDAMPYPCRIPTIPCLCHGQCVSCVVYHPHVDGLAGRHGPP